MPRVLLISAIMLPLFSCPVIAQEQEPFDFLQQNIWKEIGEAQYDAKPYSPKASKEKENPSPSIQHVQEPSPKTTPSDNTDTLDAKGETPRPGGELTTKTVEKTGIGETVDAARHDATLQAIRQVAGEYIDAKRLVDLKMDDKQLEEKLSETIISYSNAFVENVETISCKQKDNAWYCSVKVTVKAKPLLDRLAESNIPTKIITSAPIDRSTIQEQLQTEGKEQEGAESLVKRLINETLDFYDVKLVGKFTRADSNGSELKFENSFPGVWVKAGLEFRARQDTITEWQKTFAMIADSKFEASFDINSSVTSPARKGPGFSFIPAQNSYNYFQSYSPSLDRSSGNSGKSRFVVCVEFAASPIVGPGKTVLDVRAQCFSKDVEGLPKQNGEHAVEAAYANKGPKFEVVLLDENGAEINRQSFGTPFPNPGNLSAIRFKGRYFLWAGYSDRKNVSSGGVFTDAGAYAQLRNGVGAYYYKGPRVGPEVPYLPPEFLLLPKPSDVIRADLYVLLQPDELNRVNTAGIVKRW